MKALLVIAGWLAYQALAAQQHHMDEMQMPMDSMPAHMHMEHSHSTSLSQDMADTGKVGMHSAYSLSLPMSRNGSGTSWQPDESPMYMYAIQVRKWTLMLHGMLFMRYNSQNVNNKNKRGHASQIDAPNMGMLMASTPIAKNGLLTLNGMFSVDRLTMDGNGYPLLLQTGESWKDKPLVDRQHPHDLFAELSIAYTQRFTKDVDLTAYFGLPGEPALGPTTFMHRASAISNPDAPLGHHWMDATHITFGVATLGLRYKIIKVEGSIFTGREPNEQRFDFDKPRFDSYSYRVDVNPHPTLALQFSQGFIHSPEVLEPEVNIMRTTASASFTKTFRGQSFVAVTAVYGLNTALHENDHAALLEANYLIKRFDIYTRYEFVQKSAHELDLPTTISKFNLQALTLGSDYKFFSMANLDVSLGAQISGFFVPASLATTYGNLPLSYEIYFRINPAQMVMQHHNNHIN